MVPNLYSTPLDKPLSKLAAADPFGTVTLWTYFNNCLTEAARQVSSSQDIDHDIREAAKTDIVYASFLVFATTANVSIGMPKEHFLRLLNRCVISSYDIVQGSATFMHEETGVSAFEEASILQILLAVCIKHHNHDVLRLLASLKPSNRGIFKFASPQIVAQLQEANASPLVWTALVHQGGWLAESDAAAGMTDAIQNPGKRPPPFQINGQSEVPGNILRSCVKERPSAELRAYFSRIPRSLYDAIPPHHKWPGDPELVKHAAARSGSDGLEVMKLLVEIGGMEVNDAETWWKAGDYDPREWNPKCKDGSECAETALHIAVDYGNLAVVEYLLTHGAERIQDRHGRDQLSRAELRGKKEVVDLFGRHGWKTGWRNFEVPKLG